MPLMTHVSELSAAVVQRRSIMRPPFRHRLLVTALALLLAGGGLARAGDGGDHEKDHEKDHEAARRALEQGRALPLAEIRARVARRFPGEMIDVELERSGGRFVYELKVIGADGRLREVYVDATTGEILRSKAD